MLRGKKRENLFGSVPWYSFRYIYNITFCITFGRTILVTLDVSKKTLTKSHDYGRHFSQEKRQLNVNIETKKGDNWAHDRKKACLCE